MPTPEYCLLSIDWWPLCMSKAEWSGWVQAVGSILAIGVTGFAVWWTYKLQMRASEQAMKDAARESALAQMETICSLADYVVDRLQLLPQKGGGMEEGVRRAVTFPFSDLHAIAAALREFTPAHVPNGRTLIVILGIIKCVDEALQLPNHVATVAGIGTKVLPETWATLEEKAQEIRDSSQAQRALLRLQRDEYVRRF